MPLNLVSAKARFKRILQQYQKIRASDSAWFNALEGGKVYELYVLGRLLRELEKRGFVIKFVGKNLQFKTAPGKIKQNDPHFDLFVAGNPTPAFKIFLDIEFETLGSTRLKSSGKCSYHELDIVVVVPNASGRPTYEEIALGIECKSDAKFRKSYVRQALGIRRELSLLRTPQLSTLSQHQQVEFVEVPAQPPSELWLVYNDPKGNDYRESPSFFGIKFENWTP